MQCSWCSIVCELIIIILTGRFALSMAESTQPTVPSPPQTISLVGCSGISRHISRALSGGVSSKSTTCGKKREKVSVNCYRLDIVRTSNWYNNVGSYSMRRGMSKS